jgi:hypothetical protein
MGNPVSIRDSVLLSFLSSEFPSNLISGSCQLSWVSSEESALENIFDAIWEFESAVHRSSGASSGVRYEDVVLVKVRLCCL